MERPETDTFGRVLQIVGSINIALLLMGRVFLFLASAQMAARAY